ncbi:MFS transporter, DHA2 family, multidrug resistance protein [Desulfonauticus submarinus]|uniref:MFS transporter, DHA2 family, multidrug resistance protein n=1 Tax=Desulfonauticus submarinus TaxID=206665 RepID=A0A1H0BBI2_9BACT|nr:DHA2 family efflux MFS transporter permease subunit [Desulfonauticus submarinus]SDN43030.1 MFS transporter, DHA2 family, multidrug resistance protein [Desulfonauticus submarinus]
MQKQVKVNKWIIALTVILPTFIEVMDTSVVNVSLPHIQGSLNASVDESTWVLTSYLVSNAIIIPITGWLANMFGRKRYLLFSIILFTFSSLLCGAAPSLEILIIARILQGIGGGGLQPLSQAILLETFPPKEHGVAMAIFGMGVVLAPTVGPVLGGWITDNLSWRWIFYINLPAGILAVLFTIMFIFDPEYIKTKTKQYIDYIGLSLLTIGLGSLQIVLDKGEMEDWFNSNFIFTLSIIAAITLTLFVIWELKSKHPVVNLKIFKDRTFTLGNIIMFLGFFAFFGGIVLLPLYLQQLMGYTALWAGLILGPGGIATLLIMPVVGEMMRKGVHPKYLLAIGIAILGYSLILMSDFNLQADFISIAFPRIIQGIGLGLFFVPLAAATYVHIPKQEMGNATGIFNLLRNLGGSFGTAASTTLLSQRSQFHQHHLVEHITPYNPWLKQKVLMLNSFIEHKLNLMPTGKTLALIYREVIAQAKMLAFNDAFFIFGIMIFFLVPLAFFMSSAKPSQDHLIVE